MLKSTGVRRTVSLSSPVCFWVQSYNIQEAESSFMCIKMCITMCIKICITTHITMYITICITMYITHLLTPLILRPLRRHPDMHCISRPYILPKPPTCPI